MGDKEKVIPLRKTYDCGFLFYLGQEILISEIKVKAKITACLATLGCRNEYKVLYWDNGIRRNDWFYEFELEEISPAERQLS